MLSLKNINFIFNGGDNTLKTAEIIAQNLIKILRSATILFQISSYIEGLTGFLLLEKFLRVIMAKKFR